MKRLNYSKFMEAYGQLSEEYQFIIFQLLRDMEHNKDNSKDKIDYSRGLKIAMFEQELTINSLTTILEEKTGCNNLRERIASMIERGSKSSEFFKDTLEILNIDELYLIQQSEYFQTRTGNMEWIFNSIPEANQYAVYHLILQLSDLDSVRNTINILNHTNKFNTLGIISEDDNVIDYRDKTHIKNRY